MSFKHKRKNEQTNHIFISSYSSPSFSSSSHFIVYLFVCSLVCSFVRSFIRKNNHNLLLGIGWVMTSKWEQFIFGNAFHTINVRMYVIRVRCTQLVLGPFVNGNEMTTNRELFIVIIMWWYLSHFLLRSTEECSGDRFVQPSFDSNTFLFVNLVTKEICRIMIIYVCTLWYGTFFRSNWCYLVFILQL